MIPPIPLLRLYRATVLKGERRGLDLAARHRFLQTLQNLARHGKTIILVTHHVEEIFPDTRRVVLLQGGRILTDGPKAELLTAAQLSALYAAPIQIREAEGYYTARAEG